MIWRGKKTKSDVEELLICLCSLVKEVPLKFEQGPKESKGANPTGERGRTLQAEGRARPKAQRQECLELPGNTQGAEVVAEALSAHRQCGQTGEDFVDPKKGCGFHAKLGNH